MEDNPLVANYPRMGVAFSPGLCVLSPLTDEGLQNLLAATSHLRMEVVAGRLWLSHQTWKKATKQLLMQEI